MKLHVTLFIVFCTVRFIDASCNMNYGYSCWGEDDQQPFSPEEELPSGSGMIDPLAMLKILPERDPLWQLKKFFSDRTTFENQYPERTISLNFPLRSKEINPNDDQEKPRNEAIQFTDEYPRQHQPFMKSSQKA